MKQLLNPGGKTAPCNTNPVENFLMPNNPEAHEIIQTANALIERVQSDLLASREALRQHGIDPDKLDEIATANSSAQHLKDAQEAIRADREAVEQEVREEAARQSFAPSNTARPKAPRTLI